MGGGEASSSPSSWASWCCRRGYLAGTVLKVADVTGINIESIVVAVIGGVIVVAVYRMIGGRRTTA